MSSIQSIVAGMLEKSSLPSMYKNIILNLLPSMSRIQQDDILGVLLKEDSNKKVMQIRKQALAHKYGPIIDAYERDPSSVPVPYPEVMEIVQNKKKIERKESMVKGVNKNLSALKGSLTASGSGTGAASK